MATRAESLALLHDWADFAARRGTWAFCRGGELVYGTGNEQWQARSHGLNAVRATRLILRPDAYVYGYLRDTEAEAVREARLAFAAACDAIGLRPVNGHHNL
jgi:hypothetical protein